MFKTFTKEASSENPTTISRRLNVQCSAITCSRCCRRPPGTPRSAQAMSSSPGRGGRGALTWRMDTVWEKWCCSMVDVE